MPSIQPPPLKSCTHMSSTLPACITGSRSAFLCSQSSCAYSLELCRHCGNSQIGSAAPQSRPASRLNYLLSLEPCTHAVSYMSPTARAPHANAIAASTGPESFGSMFCFGLSCSVHISGNRKIDFLVLPCPSTCVCYGCMTIRVSYGHSVNLSFAAVFELCRFTFVIF